MFPELHFNQHNMRNPVIICFGEVLWDVLPTGKIAGGAPMNVAFHANQLSLSAQMISRVGDDDLGRELLDFLNNKGVSTHLIQTDPTYSTGMVNVVLDEKGSPSYDIVQPAAWDFIHPSNEMTDTVKEAEALVFGSLSCRNERSRRTLFELLDAATLRVFDVNLRTPFFSKNLLETLLSETDIVKMNDEELTQLAGFWSAKTDERSQIEFIKKKFNLASVIVTRGPYGAALLNDEGFYLQKGFKVEVQDTIGSGDAFLGAFLSRMLTGLPAQECLEFACAAGAFVATKKGGTPAYSSAELLSAIN